MARSKHASPPKRCKRYRAAKTLNEKIERMERNLAAPGLRIQNSIKAQISATAGQLSQRRIELAQPLDDEQSKNIATICRIGLEHLLEGDACIDDYGNVVQALNMSIVLTERGIGEEHAESLQLALDAIFVVYLRAQETGKWSLDIEQDREDVRAIELGLDIHEGQIEIATQAEIVWSVVEVERRQKAGIDVYRMAA